MKKIIAILLALAVVSMAFAQTVSIPNKLSTDPEITIDGGKMYWGFANSNFLRDEVTRKRESEALTMMSKRLPCRRRLILTYDEEEVISDKFGSIEVLLVWKWLLM